MSYYKTLLENLTFGNIKGGLNSTNANKQSTIEFNFSSNL